MLPDQKPNNPHQSLDDLVAALETLKDDPRFLRAVRETATQLASGATLAILETFIHVHHELDHADAHHH